MYFLNRPDKFTANVGWSRCRIHVPGISSYKSSNSSSIESLSWQFRIACWILSVRLDVLLQIFLYSIYSSNGHRSESWADDGSDYLRFMIVWKDCLENRLRAVFLVRFDGDEVMTGPDIFSFKSSFLKMTLMDFREFLLTVTGSSLMFWMESRILVARFRMLGKSKGSLSSAGDLGGVGKKSLK
jgi:hypothetical protein